MLFLILGPSGVGKGTQISLLRERCPEFVFPKSVTTRKMRPGETEGNPYYFISDAEFDAHIEHGDFLEWAQVHKAARYGTLREPIEKSLRENKTVIKELDIQGLLQIKKTIAERSLELFQKNLRSIFILPPDEETLISRITSRSAIKEMELAARLESAKKEVAQKEQCDFIVETTRQDSIENVYQKLIGIILHHC